MTIDQQGRGHEGTAGDGRDTGNATLGSSKVDLGDQTCCAIQLYAKVQWGGVAGFVAKILHFIPNSWTNDAVPIY